MVISQAIHVENSLLDGAMSNIVSDLMLLKGLGVSLTPAKAPKILEVFWCRPFSCWIKVNTNGAINGAHGLLGGGENFQDS